jgi:hypothetical protein
LLALFIISTLAPGDFPSAYQTKFTATVGERHEKEASLHRMADEDLASLSAGMIRGPRGSWPEDPETW